MGRAEHSDQMVVRIKEVKTEHLAQRLSTKKKERDYGEEVAGDSKSFQVFFSFCHMTKSNLEKKVFISFSLFRLQFIFGGSQEELTAGIWSQEPWKNAAYCLAPKPTFSCFSYTSQGHRYRWCYPQWTGLSCINYQSRKRPLMSV